MFRFFETYITITNSVNYVNYFINYVILFVCIIINFTL